VIIADKTPGGHRRWRRFVGHISRRHT